MEARAFSGKKICTINPLMKIRRQQSSFSKVHLHNKKWRKKMQINLYEWAEIICTSTQANYYFTVSLKKLLQE